MVPCEECHPEGRCQSELPPQEDVTSFLQKSDGVENGTIKKSIIVSTRDNLAFSSSNSKDENWCRKCNPNLPPHEHQPGGSVLVKTAEGAEEIRTLTYVLSDGKHLKMSVSYLFKEGLQPILLGQPLYPLADMGDLEQLICDTEEAFRASITQSPRENWDLDKALEFIEGVKAAPQTKKKAKKKKKKLTEEPGEQVKQKNNALDNHSEEDTFTAGCAEELKASTNHKVQATLTSMESDVKECEVKLANLVEEKCVLQQEEFVKARMELEVALADYHPEQKETLLDEDKLLLKSLKFVSALDSKLKTETEKLLAENEELRKLKEEQAKIDLRRIQKLELKLEQIGASEKMNVAREIQVLQEEKKEMQTKLEFEQNRAMAAEEGLKVKVSETDKLLSQNETLSFEKAKMQSQLAKVKSQLEGVKKSLSLKQIERAADEKGLKRLTNQVESMTEQLKCEQNLRKAAEEELKSLKQRDKEWSKFLQQMTVAGETFLKSKQEELKAEEDIGDERRHSKQFVESRDLQPSVNCTSHERLVEKLLKQIKQLPISPADCSRLVQKLRASRGGLSGLPMEVIKEEVRKLAMEEAEVKANECPICFDPMVSNLLHCMQCNQAFHDRCWNEWAQLHPKAAECPICRT